MHYELFISTMIVNICKGGSCWRTHCAPRRGFSLASVSRENQSKEETEERQAADIRKQPSPQAPSKPSDPMSQTMVPEICSRSQFWSRIMPFYLFAYHIQWISQSKRGNPSMVSPEDKDQRKKRATRRIRLRTAPGPSNTIIGTKTIAPDPAESQNKAETIVWQTEPYE